MANEVKLAKGNQLLSIVNAIYDMELNVYMMNATLVGLQEKMNGLGIRYNYRKPEREKVHYLSKADPGGSFGYAIMAAFIGAVIGLLIGTFVIAEPFLDAELLDIILFPLTIIVGAFHALLDDFGGLLTWTLSGAGLGIAVCIIASIVIYLNKIKKNNEAYKNELKEYEATLARQEIRIENEFAQKAIIKEEYDKLYRKYCDTSAEIVNSYSVAGIDKNFRNITSMALMGELLRLQICTELGGPNGLYAYLRREYREWYMIQKLEEICDLLRSISRDIGNLRDDMRTMNKNSENLIRETENISKLTARTAQSSAITAYTVQQARREAATRDMIDTIFRT